VHVVRQIGGIFRLDLKWLDLQVAGEISSEGILVLEELQAQWIALEELQAWLIVWEEFLAWRCLGGASGKALSSFPLEFSTASQDTTLEECGDGLECSHPVDWSRVLRGGAACTFVLVYLSIRLRERK